MKLHTEINEFEDKDPVKYLIEWESPDRLWKEKDRSWFVVYSFFFVVVIAMLFLMGEFLLIVLVLAFMFLWYVQGMIPPTNVKHVISTLGIKTENKLYQWRDIDSFWVSKKDDFYFLNLDVFTTEDKNNEYKRRVSILLNEVEPKTIFNLLIKNIHYGSKDKVGANVLNKFVYGEYVEVDEFMEKVK